MSAISRKKMKTRRSGSRSAHSAEYLGPGEPERTGGGVVEGDEKLAADSANDLQDLQGDVPGAFHDYPRTTTLLQHKSVERWEGRGRDTLGTIPRCSVDPFRRSLIGRQGRKRRVTPTPRGVGGGGGNAWGV